MHDIYNLLYKKVHDQCLKLLEPNSEWFTFHELTLTDEELEVIEDVRIIKSVKSGSPDLANIKDDLPVIYLELGTGGIDFIHESIANQMKGELFHVKIRVVVPKPSLADTYDYAKSTPVTLLAIRHSLEYLLDTSITRGLSASRIGYEFPSRVWQSGIIATEALEGLPPSYDAIDWRFVAEIHKQAMRD